MIGLREGQQFEVTSDFMRDNILVFKSFGDGIHNLTGGEVMNDPYNVTFNLTEIEVCHRNNQREFGKSVFIWLENDLLDYQFFNPGRA